MVNNCAALVLRLLVALVLVLPVAQSTRPTTGNIYFYNSYVANTEVGYWKIPKNPPAQRCYSFSCHQEELSFVKWNHMQENAWLVFYDDVGCKGNYIRAFGHEGTLRPDDSGFDNRLASFMMWESGIYATRGIVDTCPEERAVAQTSSPAPTHGPRAGRPNNTRARGSNHSNIRSEAEVGMDYDVAVGVVKPAEFTLNP